MPVIDLIIRIKNGYMSQRETVTSPYSRFRETVLKKLKELGYIEDYSVSGETIKEIEIVLKYVKGERAMTDVKIFSKPGRRWYIAYKDLRPVRSGMGRVIMSSSKGIITDKEAKKLCVGGELLFHVW